MSITKKQFGKANKEQIYLYTIKNKNGMIAKVTNYGAILTELWVKNKNTELKDVVLGFDKLKDYKNNPSFFGATIGPNANRIKDAKFTIDDKEYHLAVNDGPNNLHSDKDLGYHKRIWNVKEKDNSIEFTLEDKETMGFPGNKKISVTYTLTDDNELKLDYKVTTDKKSLINMTNHTYFNLNGHNSGKITNHTLKLNCSKYTEILSGAIPTGNILEVKNTVFDFTNDRLINKSIDENLEQLTMVQGYDHNLVIDNYDKTLREVAILTNDDKSLQMQVFTDLPGIQFYAGNCIDKQVGKENTTYNKRDGLCLETQYYPDTINNSSFPQCVFNKENPYKTTTIYKFI